MGFAWAFKEATPGDRARESQVEKFFSSDAVRDRANAVVREGIQNSLDAAADQAPVHIRITLGEWTAHESHERLPVYAQGLQEHLRADGVALKIKRLPRDGDPFRFLVFEDFGTSGLKGDPAQWWTDERGEAGAFFKYFRAEGISGKGDGARGRHGVGRLVFMFASRIRAMYGLTIRDEGRGAEELLMGTTVLCNHRMAGTPFLPDGWFGVPDSKQKALTLPVRDLEAIGRFKRDFLLTRSGEPGLSVVVPWLAEDVTFSDTLYAVVSEYFYPVLAGRLTVELVCGEQRAMVDRTSIGDVVAAQPEYISKRLAPLLDLARAALEQNEWLRLQPPAGDYAPRWDDAVVGEAAAKEIHRCLESGERVFLQVPVKVRPKGAPAVDSSFRICLERDPAIGDSQIHFIREGIIVSDVRPRRTSGVRALVIAGHGALGQFLGDAENPSHTQWHKDMVKEGYTYAPAQLEYVVQCVPALLAAVSQKQRQPDISLLLDLFAIPAKEGFRKPLPEKKPKPGPESDQPKPEIKPTPKRYAITRKGTGFVVRRGDEGAPRPAVLSVRAAYDVRRGNAFTKYNPADFIFGHGGISLHSAGCEVASSGPNWAVVRVLQDDFEFGIQGFDVSTRDLRVDVRVKAEAPAAQQGEEMV